MSSMVLYSTKMVIDNDAATEEGVISLVSLPGPGKLKLKVTGDLAAVLSEELTTEPKTTFVLTLEPMK